MPDIINRFKQNWKVFVREPSLRGKLSYDFQHFMDFIY